ncbi:MAG: TMF family protein [Methylococcaceae bacterium]|nr:TMF family protein [Methylococcaceae bacterium]
MNNLMNRLIPIALLTLSPAAFAEEDLRALLKELSNQVSELKNQAKQSEQRIHELESKLQQNELEKRQAKTAATATTAPIEPAKPTKPAVTAGDVKDSFKIPGTDTSIGFGGYVKLDANYSNIGMGRDKLGNQHLVLGQIPIGADRLGERSRSTFHAKESRFWLKSFTPSSWGDINTFLELDLLGAADTFNYTPRLRHAYGSIGNFLAGQTWTTLLNTSAIPDTLDPTGPVGALLYGRQPQIRWTQPFTVAGAPLEFQVAAESPRSRLWAAPANKIAADGYGFAYEDTLRYPDIVARLNYNPDWGSLSISGVGRQIRYVTLKTKDAQEDWGGAVSLAGRINTFGLDNLRFMLNYGDALGRYAAVNAFEDAALDATGRLRLVNTYGGLVAYQHWWDKSWRSTVGYGFVKADQPSFVTGEMNRQAQSLTVNLLWSPVPQTTFGVEYIYVTRQRVDGETGDLHRLQASARFNF